MTLAYSGLAFVVLLAGLGVALIVVVVFRSKKPRAHLRKPSVAPVDDADRPH